MRQVLLCLLLAAYPAVWAATPDAAELMARSHATTLVRGAEMQLRFELVSASGNTRIRKVTSLGRTDPLTREISRRTRYDHPPQDRGLAVLLVEHDGQDDELWVYVPAVKKTRRLIADSKRDSFMGTVLSYGDVLGHKPGDWTHRVTGQDVYEGQPCWLVESLPASAAVQKQTGYSKRLSCIDQTTAFNLRMELWDESGRPAKRIENRDIRAVVGQAGTFVAHDILAISLKDGERSRLVMQRFEPKPALGAESFKPSALVAEAE